MGTGTPRSFATGALLTFVTLGIYPLYWHYATHKELLDWHGYPSKDLRLYGWYLGLAITSPVFYIIVTSGHAAGMSAEDMLIHYAGWLWLSSAAVLAAFILWVRYVNHQIALQRAVKTSLQVPMHGSTQGFFALTLGWIPLSFIFGIGFLLAPFLLLLAYHRMQTDYNDIWRAVAARYLLTGHDAAPPKLTYRVWNPVEDAPPTAKQAGASTTATDTGTTVAKQRAAASSTILRQDVKCPKCDTANRIRGIVGQLVHVRCVACGASGRLRVTGEP